MPPDLLYQVMMMLVGAVVGQALSMVTPALIDAVRLRRGPDLIGRWISIYRPDFRDETRWVQEKIDVTYRRERVVMQNAEHPTADLYSVTAEVVDKAYLIGRWHSRRPGANASGTIMLTISPLGDFMYGYFTGLGDTGERTYCSWVLVREPHQVDRAIKLATTMTLDFTQSPSGLLAEKPTE